MNASRYAALQTLDIQRFPAMFVPFTTLKLKAASGFWISPSAPPAWPQWQAESSQWQQMAPLRRMALTWGIAAPDPWIFQPSYCEPEQHVTAWTEAYGGSLSGGNGGGARVGLVDGMQIKGLGRTPMLSKQADPQHGYGALFLEQAIGETLYSHLAQRILPYGCAQIHGLILTGVPIVSSEHVLKEWQGEADSALLLRQPCLRPAHFMSAGLFASHSGRHDLLQETQRLRLLYRELAALSRGSEGFEHLIYTFLSRCAQQFASARLHRLVHGTLSPSNIALDGRWLDLMSASVLPCDNNSKPHPQAPAFLQEYRVPGEIASQLIYLFNKYNRRNIDEQPFLAHYEQAWRHALLTATARLLNFSVEAWPRSADTFTTLREITEAFHQRIMGSGKIVPGWATLPQVAEATTDTFLPQNDALWDYFYRLLEEDARQSTDRLARLIANEWRSANGQKPPQAAVSLAHFRTAWLLRVGKKLLFLPSLCRSRIDNLVRQQLEAGHGQTQHWLGEQIDFIDELLEKGHRCVKLLSLPSSSLCFDSLTGEFIFIHGQRVIREPSPEKLLPLLDAAFPQGAIQHNFDFLPGCRALLQAAALYTPQQVSGSVAKEHYAEQ